MIGPLLRRVVKTLLESNSIRVDLAGTNTHEVMNLISIDVIAVRKMMSRLERPQLIVVIDDEETRYTL